MPPLTHPSAVLFDIDGTIMRAGGAGRAALARAAVTACGASPKVAEAVVAELDLRGNTDGRIFASLGDSFAARAGSSLRWDRAAFTEAYLRALDATLSEKVVELLPGVLPLIAALEAKGVHVGLLTGNLREGARRKLRAVQLERLVERDGGFGDDGHTRPEVAQVAGRRLLVAGVQAARIVVIGDTPHDVTAAQAAGMHAVAVATGWNNRPELERLGANAVFDDLADTAAVVRSLWG